KAEPSPAPPPQPVPALAEVPPDDPLLQLLSGEMQLPDEPGEALGALLGDEPVTGVAPPRPLEGQELVDLDAELDPYEQENAPELSDDPDYDDISIEVGAAAAESKPPPAEVPMESLDFELDLGDAPRRTPPPPKAKEPPKRWSRPPAAPTAAPPSEAADPFEVIDSQPAEADDPFDVIASDPLIASPTDRALSVPTVAEPM